MMDETNGKGIMAYIREQPDHLCTNTFTMEHMTELLDDMYKSRINNITANEPTWHTIRSSLGEEFRLEYPLTSEEVFPEDRIARLFKSIKV